MEKNLQPLRPFKLWVLQNFPFIEEDFDALTNYEMMCKIVAKLNEVVNISNKQSETINTLNNAFNQLTSYVNNYFDNLDVQEEINNKLDEMTESGQLEEIITEYLKLKGLLSFDTVADMIVSENLVNGSNVRTLGKDTYNDGKGAFYKIRDITNDDVVDGVHIIAMETSDTLIAELLPDYEINLLKNTINSINETLNNINQNLIDVNSDLVKLNRTINKKYIFIGDSYNEGYGHPDYNLGWGLILKDYLNLTNNDYYNLYEGGSGFVHVGNSGHTFQTLLESYESDITNKNDITDIIIVGGYNDYDSNDESTINTAIGSMMSYIKTNYPNAKTYIGMVGNNSDWSNSGLFIRNYLSYKVLPAYKDCQKYGCRQNTFYSRL